MIGIEGNKIKETQLRRDMSRVVHEKSVSTNENAEEW